MDHPRQRMKTLPVRGREHELGVLSTAVEDAVRGEGAVLVVEGEAGIGKSRLLAEAADVASRAGLAVAAGASDELDELAPLTSFLAALRGSTRPLVPADLLDGVSGSADQRLALLDRLGASIEERAGTRRCSSRSTISSGRTRRRCWRCACSRSSSFRTPWCGSWPGDRIPRRWRWNELSNRCRCVGHDGSCCAPSTATRSQYSSTTCSARARTRRCWRSSTAPTAIPST